LVLGSGLESYDLKVNLCFFFPHSARRSAAFRLTLQAYGPIVRSCYCWMHNRFYQDTAFRLHAPSAVAKTFRSAKDFFGRTSTRAYRFEKSLIDWSQPTLQLFRNRRLYSRLCYTVLSEPSIVLLTRHELPGHNTASVPKPLLQSICETSETEP
jgi:hypothetical protein